VSFDLMPVFFADIFRSMKRTLPFLLFLLFVNASIPLTGLGQTRSSSPIEIRLEGLRDRVVVRRDERSIPYIEAKNDADLYFVQGYVTASDRLWQMDLLRRVARGETAELFGRQTLEEDKRWRRFGFARIAEATVAASDPDVLAALQNYSRGVNAYISALTDETIPAEFRILQIRPRPWTPADSVVIGKILAEALSSTYQHDLRRDALKGIDPAKLADLTNPVTPYDVILFGTDTSPSRSAASGTSPRIGEAMIAAANVEMALRARSLQRIGLYAEDLAASNNWVISGKRTVDGKPILANDPHLMPAAPGIWYIVHLSTPSMRVAGVTFPGSAGVVLGHNEHIAWGATNVGPDVQDLYLETFNDDGKYQTPKGWAPPTIRREEIKVRTNLLQPATAVEILDVTETRNGPIIIDTDSRKLALKWTAFDTANREFDAFFHLNRAKNWEEFKRALSGYGGAMQNFIFADTKGNIGWYAAGKVPIRRNGDGSLPFEGSGSDGDWIGHIPFDELPNLYNPPSGFIMTANQRIVGMDYKYPQIARDFAPPWRARRLFDLLMADTKATMDSTAAAQHDVYNIPVAMLAKEIISVNAASEENIKALKEWDGRMTPGSYAALLASEIRVCAANKIAEANKPVPGALIREKVLHRAVAERSSRWLPKEFADYAALLRSCEGAALNTFTSRYGADRSGWVFGRATAARFPHALAAAPLIGSQFTTPNTPIGGSGQTPNVGSGVSMRFIASPGNWDATRLVIPLGQSGDPRSSHYKDQFEKWRTGEPAVFPFTKDAVERSASSVTNFVKP
jgi:penicillin G amidase